MSSEKIQTLLQVVAKNLNLSASNIDLAKSFDDNGGDSLALMSTLNDLSNDSTTFV